MWRRWCAMRVPSLYYRAGIAFVSAVAALVALYLHRAKMGAGEAEAVDPFAFCDTGGGCAAVQTSAWSWFLGIDVALIGAVGFAGIFVASLIAIHPRWASARWPTLALAGLIYPAVLFTARLKYAEFVILDAFCPWCAVLTVAIAFCAVLVTLDVRRTWNNNDGQDPTDGTWEAEPAR